MPKNIEYPTDSRLYEKARVILVKLANKHDINLRQNYNLVTKKLIRKLGGYLHAKQMKRANKLIKHLKVIVGRIQRDISRKIENNSNKNKKAELVKIFEPALNQTTRLLAQQKKDKNKLYSLHEPEVICINKGKSHKRSEFGSKVSTVITAKQGLVINNESLQGNSYDGHTLKPALAKAEEITGIKIKEAAVDKGYRGHKIDEEQDNIKIFISGQRKGLTKTIKKKIKRRQAIEPIIGQMKQDGKLDVCRLKGIQGNEINAILSGAGWNLRILLNYIRKIIKSGDSSGLQKLKEAIILLWKNLSKEIQRILQILPNYFLKNSGFKIC